MLGKFWKRKPKDSSDHSRGNRERLKTPVPAVSSPPVTPSSSSKYQIIFRRFANQNKLSRSTHWPSEGASLQSFPSSPTAPENRRYVSTTPPTTPPHTDASTTLVNSALTEQPFELESGQLKFPSDSTPASPVSWEQKTAHKTPYIHGDLDAWVPSANKSFDDEEEDVTENPIYNMLQREPTLRHIWDKARLVVIPSSSALQELKLSPNSGGAQLISPAYASLHVFSPSPMYKDHWILVQSLLPPSEQALLPSTNQHQKLPNHIELTINGEQGTLTAVSTYLHNLKQIQSELEPKSYFDTSNAIRGIPHTLITSAKVISEMTHLRSRGRSNAFRSDLNKVRILQVSSLLLPQSQNLSTTSIDPSLSIVETGDRRSSVVSQNGTLRRSSRAASLMSPCSSLTSQNQDGQSGLIPYRRNFNNDLAFMKGPPSVLSELSTSFEEVLNFFTEKVSEITQSFLPLPDIEFVTCSRLRRDILAPGKVRVESDISKLENVSSTLLSLGSSKLFHSLLENVILGLASSIRFSLVLLHKEADDHLAAICHRYEAKNYSLKDWHISFLGSSRVSKDLFERPICRLRCLQPQASNPTDPAISNCGGMQTGSYVLDILTPLDVLGLISEVLMELSHIYDNPLLYAQIQRQGAPSRPAFFRHHTTQSRISGGIDSDTLIPLLSFCLVQAKLNSLHTLCVWSSKFRLEPSATPDISFASVTFQAAIRFLASDPLSNKTLTASGSPEPRVSYLSDRIAEPKRLSHARPLSYTTVAPVNFGQESQAETSSAPSSKVKRERHSSLPLTSSSQFLATSDGISSFRSHTEAIREGERSTFAAVGQFDQTLANTGALGDKDEMRRRTLSLLSLTSAQSIVDHDPLVIHPEVVLESTVKLSRERASNPTLSSSRTLTLGSCDVSKRAWIPPAKRSTSLYGLASMIQDPEAETVPSFVANAAADVVRRIRRYSNASASKEADSKNFGRRHLRSHSSVDTPNSNAAISMESSKSSNVVQREAAVLIKALGNVSVPTNIPRSLTRSITCQPGFRHRLLSEKRVLGQNRQSKAGDSFLSTQPSAMISLPKDAIIKTILSMPRSSSSNALSAFKNT